MQRSIENIIYSVNLRISMITNAEKCKHIFEFIMSSKVCKRCGLIESFRSPIYEKKPAQEEIPAPA